MSLVESYIAEYIDALQSDCEGELGELQRRAYEEGLPIVPKEVAKLLSFIVGLIRPKAVLEIGMAVGFSSCLMSQLLPEGGHIKTIDRYPYMIGEAKKNFKRFNVEDKVTILEGSALEILPTLDEKFDFVFMDAAKGQYINMLPDVLRLTKKGSVIMVDDVLQDGRVAKDRLAVERRQRTIHTRLNDFLREITHSAVLRTSILTIGDGVALIEKLED